jgi:hypothetical protein
LSRDFEGETQLEFLPQGRLLLDYTLTLRSY